MSLRAKRHCEITLTPLIAKEQAEVRTRRHPPVPTREWARTAVGGMAACRRQVV
jgi:hypothetical protein